MAVSVSVQIHSRSILVELCRVGACRPLCFDDDARMWSGRLVVATAARRSRPSIHVDETTMPLAKLQPRTLIGRRAFAIRWRACMHAGTLTRLHLWGRLFFPNTRRCTRWFWRKFEAYGCGLAHSGRSTRAGLSGAEDEDSHGERGYWATDAR
jgi:hypothetical protein